MIILVPNPRRVGGRTAGPSFSTHFKDTRPASSMVQEMISLPPGAENAPYLAALVLTQLFSVRRL